MKTSLFYRNRTWRMMVDINIPIDELHSFSVAVHFAQKPTKRQQRAVVRQAYRDFATWHARWSKTSVPNIDIPNAKVDREDVRNFRQKIANSVGVRPELLKGKE